MISQTSAVGQNLNDEGWAPNYNLAKFSPKQLHENEKEWASRWCPMRHFNRPICTPLNHLKFSTVVVKSHWLCPVPGPEP